MDYEVIFRAIVSLPKILYYKIRYNSKLSLPWVQSLGAGSRFRVKRGARLSVGRELVSRENLVLRAEGGSLTIGDKCFFNTSCSVTCLEKIEIGDGCQIANHVVIVDHDHNPGFKGYRTSPVKIGNRVWIGANCVILKGTVIGDDCVIGAGSVVSGTVAPGTIYYQKREKAERKING